MTRLKDEVNKRQDRIDDLINVLKKTLSDLNIKQNGKSLSENEYAFFDYHITLKFSEYDIDLKEYNGDIRDFFYKNGYYLDINIDNIEGSQIMTLSLREIIDKKNIFVSDFSGNLEQLYPEDTIPMLVLGEENLLQPSNTIIRSGHYQNGSIFINKASHDTQGEMNATISNEVGHYVLDRIINDKFAPLSKIEESFMFEIIGYNVSIRQIHELYSDVYELSYRIRSNQNLSIVNHINDKINNRKGLDEYEFSNNILRSIIYTNNPKKEVNLLGKRIRTEWLPMLLNQLNVNHEKLVHEFD